MSGSARDEARPEDRAHAQGAESSFATLVLEKGYERTRITDIANDANVSRSTFYEHFEGKADMLQQSLSRIFKGLADSVDESCDAARLKRVLEHFWENRRVGRSMLFGSTRRAVSRSLAALIEARLVALSSNTRPSLPMPLVASQLAGAQLSLIEAWFDDDASCAAEAIARALRDTTSRLTTVLLQG